MEAIGEGVPRLVGRRPGSRRLAGRARAGSAGPAGAAGRTSAPAARFTAWDRDGGFAERIVVAADVALRVPDDFDDLGARLPFSAEGSSGTGRCWSPGSVPAAAWASTVSARRLCSRSRSPATGVARFTSRPARRASASERWRWGRHPWAATTIPRPLPWTRPSRSPRPAPWSWPPCARWIAAARWPSTRSISTGSPRSPTGPLVGAEPAQRRQLHAGRRAGVPRSRRDDPGPHPDRGVPAGRWRGGPPSPRERRPWTARRSLVP